MIVGKEDQSRSVRFLGKADARAEQTAREDRETDAWSRGVTGAGLDLFCASLTDAGDDQWKDGKITLLGVETARAGGGRKEKSKRKGGPTRQCTTIHQPVPFAPGRPVR